MPCTSSASVADGAPAGPDPDLPQLTQGCPPDPLQDAVSPLLGPRGPTSREQANREAGVAHSTTSTPQESASAHWELRAQPREHPTRCPPPGRPPDPTLNPLHGPFQAAEPRQNPPELRQAKCADINSESPGVSVPQRPQRCVPMDGTLDHCLSLQFPSPFWVPWLCNASLSSQRSAEVGAKMWALQRVLERGCEALLLF